MEHEKIKLIFLEKNINDNKTFLQKFVITK